eukprot:361525-Chlamydomonas_euryale.AAC.15
MDCLGFTATSHVLDRAGSNVLPTICRKHWPVELKPCLAGLPWYPVKMADGAADIRLDVGPVTRNITTARKCTQRMVLCSAQIELAQQAVRRPGAEVCQVLRWPVPAQRLQEYCLQHMHDHS